MPYGISPIPTNIVFIKLILHRIKKKTREQLDF